MEYKDKELFTKYAFLLWEHRECILSDSRMAKALYERDQRLVRRLPSFGIWVTKRWYLGYQALVSGLPRCGNRTTKMWYWDYQNAVVPPPKKNVNPTNFYLDCFDVMMLRTISSVLHMASAPILVRLWMLSSKPPSTIEWE